MCRATLLCIVLAIVPFAGAQVCNSMDLVNRNGLFIPAFGTGGSKATITTMDGSKTLIDTCTRNETASWENENGCLSAPNDPQPMAVVYLLLLFWCFLGVGIIADMFMGAIEVITSKRRLVEFTNDEGETEQVQIFAWNATVANLTLMALGSSAPEILLSVIEIFSLKFYSGELGPSTIVGSAAFNLMCITAVCISAIPSRNEETGETGVRRIDDLRVFGVTALFSVFAYLWLVVILLFVSPDVVEFWEALLTFLFFPLLVTLAFMADAGYCTRRQDKDKLQAVVDHDDHTKIVGLEDIEMGAVGENGATKKDSIQFTNIRQADKLLMGTAKRGTDAQVLADAAFVYKMKRTNHSRAVYRSNATRMLTGGKEIWPDLIEMEASVTTALGAGGGEEKKEPTICVGFDAVGQHCLESSKKVELTVTRKGGEGTVTVDYVTVAGTAEADKDFVSTKGTLTFEKDESQTITVEILEDDEVEQDEHFTVQLSNATGGAVVTDVQRSCQVTIIDDDSVGKVGFSETEDGKTAASYICNESCGTVRVRVERTEGSSGKVSVFYATREKSATKDVDYKHTEGRLTFLTGEVVKFIEVVIYDDDKFEKDEKFFIDLSDPEGCELANLTTAVVVIENDDEMSRLAEKVAHLLKLNLDKYKVSKDTWKEQFTDAWTWPSEESCFTKFLHCLSMPWKLVFALTPPPSLCGGWLCFFIALAMIGLTTALIGDLAAHFGCAVGLAESITAITFVALGTSLPDTFASKTAAVMDSNADNSIGNITGSNSVNVFLGLGLPWLIAAIKWSFCTPAGDALVEWKARVPLAVSSAYPNGVFYVAAGSLVFSVLIFSLCACLTLGLLVLRRYTLGAELGGPGAKYASAVCVFLWFVYIGASIYDVEK